MRQDLLFQELKDAVVTVAPGDGDAAEGVEEGPLVRSLIEIGAAVAPIGGTGCSPGRS